MRGRLVVVRAILLAKQTLIPRWTGREGCCCLGAIIIYPVAGKIVIGAHTHHDNSI